MKCTRCWEDKPASIHCRRVNKNGSVYIRYICNDCRNERARELRLSKLSNALDSLRSSYERRTNQTQV